jgi:porin
VFAALWLAFQVELALGESSPTSQQAVEPNQSVEVLESDEFRGHLVAPDDVTRELEWLDKSKDTLFDNTATDRLLNRWRSKADQLKTGTGLDLGLAYTVLYQRLTDTRDSHDPKQGAVGDLDIFGEWSLPGTEKERSGFLGFEAEVRTRLFTSSRPSDLGDSAGSLWETTNDFDTQDMSLVQLWWQQKFAEDALTYRIGKVDQTDFFDVGSLKSADLFFSNFAFSENPALANPDPGWGGAVHLDLDKGWYLITAIGDANGSRTSIAANDLYDKNDYFTAAEFGLTPTIEGLGQGYYQLTAWHTDGRDNRNEPDQPSGKGFSLRFEQKVGEDVQTFVTYSRASGGATDVRQLVTAGLGLSGIFGNRDDITGVAVAWGQPEDRSLRNQYVAELFYRVQLTEHIQVTPDLQLIAEPSRNRDNDTIGVLGLRMRLLF